MTQRPLSPKALGLLVQIYLEGAPGGAEGLAKTFSVGVKYVLSGLKELRSMGLVDTIKGKGSNGQFWAELNVTEEGVRYCENMVNRMPKRSAEPHAILGSSISQNSYLADTPYSKGANSVKRRTNGVRSKKKYKTMEVNVNDFGGTPMDPDDIAELQAKDKKRKREERLSRKTQKVEERAKSRASKTVQEWTAQDSVSYFAEQVTHFWQIPDHHVDIQKFFFALSNFQAKYNTDGPLEKIMIDNYLSSIKQDTAVQSADHLWRRFMTMAPSLVEDARRDSVTPEQLEEIRNNALQSKTRRDL
jgi:hypothetical protein